MAITPAKGIAKLAVGGFKAIGNVNADREVFAPIILFFGKKVGQSRVRALNKAYTGCMNAKITPGLYNAFRREMDALINLVEQLPAGEREQILSEIYERYQAVIFRMDDIDTVLADALRVSARNLPRSTSKAAEALLKRKIAALKAQTAAEISRLLQKARFNKLSKRELELLKDLRQFKRIVKTHDGPAWAPIYEYLSIHNEAIRATRNLSPEDAAKALAGYRNKVQGLLGEVYSLRCTPWLDRRKVHLMEAFAAAKRLGRGSKVVTVTGTIRLNGKETWDEAILIIREARSTGGAPEAILHTAVQTKVEKQISAVEQIINDRLREKGLSIYQPSLLEIEGKKPLSYVLRPNPEAVQPYRYLLHAQGGKLSKPAIKRLTDSGIVVNRKELDMMVEQFNRIADCLLNASKKTNLAQITKNSP